MLALQLCWGSLIQTLLQDELLESQVGTFHSIVLEELEGSSRPPTGLRLISYVPVSLASPYELALAGNAMISANYRYFLSIWMRILFMY